MKRYNNMKLFRSRAAHSGVAAVLGAAVMLLSFQAHAQGRRPTNDDAEEPKPPGAAKELPSTMDKISERTDVEFRAKPGGHRVRFNLQDADLAELVNHISGMTGKRFIYGAKVRKIKATVVSPEPVTLNEAYQAFLSILQVNGMTVVPHGRFLKIVDSAGVVANGSPLYSRGAPIPNTDNYITRLYRTRFVSPDEASALLVKFKSKEGDISTYPSGNLLVITDTGSQIRRMVRILEEIDVGGAGQQMWIEPVNHGGASDMAQRINDLFEVGEGTGGGLVKVIADEQTNSLIIVGTDDSYNKLLQVMKRLDTRAGDFGSVHVLPLQHAVVTDLSKTLQQMLSGKAKGKGSSGVGSAGGMFEGEIMVTPDKATNSLVISSSPRDFAQLRMVVDRLDQPRRQVFIEAVIMDVGVSDSDDLGFAWHGGKSDVNTGGEDSTILGGFNAGQSMAFPLDPSSLSGFAAGIRGPDLPGSNNQLAPGISIPAFGVVMNALSSSGRANVLATPHIIATDNIAAEINVGENIPLQTNAGGGISSLAALGAGGAVAGGNLAAMNGFGFNAPREDVGNKIKVTPHINESDQVRLEIEQESSAPGTPTGNLGVIPITKRTAKTTVVVKDQQTVVIGGLMQEKYITSKDKVPILGDIPILGVLFRSTHTEKKKTNLLLILTPHVIREQADLRRIFERKMQERQEFIDRHFIFATDSWDPQMDYTRANGLIEDIRQAYFEVDDQSRLEAELSPREMHDHTPGEAIEMPGSVRPAKGRGAPRKATPRRPAKKKAPAKKPPAKKRSQLDASSPSRTAALDITTQSSSSHGPALRVAPLVRSVPPRSAPSTLPHSQGLD